MNATVKAYGSKIASWKSSALPLILIRPQFRIALLIVAVLFSAFAIVYTKDLSRRLFMGYQDARQNYNELNVSYGKLLLEVGALSSQLRIQQIAEQRGMELPSAKNTIVIKL
jgi:cell division protein FtsL